MSASNKEIFVPRSSEKILLSPLFYIIVVSLGSIFTNYLFYEQTLIRAYAIYISGILSFIISYFSFKILRFVSGAPMNYSYSIRSYKAPQYIVVMYCIFTLLGVVIASFLYLNRGFSHPGNLMLNLRYAHTVAHLPTYGALHFVVFAIALSAYYMHRGEIKKSLIMLSLYIYTELAFAERTGILLGLVGVSYVGLWYRRLKDRHLAMIIGVFIALIVLVALSARKLMISGELFLLPYFSYGLSVFNDWYLDDAWQGCIDIIFGTAGTFILDTFHVHCASRISEIPRGFFNVATYAREPYVVAGTIGVIVTMSILGLLYSILHSRAERVGGYYVALLGFLNYAVIMTFYAWQFTLTTYLYLALALAPLFLYARRGLAERN